MSGCGQKYSKRIELVILYSRRVVLIGMSQPQEIVVVCNTSLYCIYSQTRCIPRMSQLGQNDILDRSNHFRLRLGGFNTACLPNTKCFIQGSQQDDQVECRTLDYGGGCWVGKWVSCSTKLQLPVRPEHGVISGINPIGFCGSQLRQIERFVAEMSPIRYNMGTIRCLRTADITLIIRVSGQGNV